MKKIIFSLVVLAFVLTSCNEEKKETSTTSVEPAIATEPVSDVVATPPSEADVPVSSTTPTPETTQGETAVKVAAVEKFSIQQIVNNYLAVKNALAKDNASGAAKASKTLNSTLKATKANAIEGNNKKTFLEIAETAKEHTEHIGDNGNNIEHQREHFALLSNDMNDLIKTFGSTAKLYQDFCPMYDNGKGAYWISEIKEIKNPYYGASMSTCGSVKKTY